MFDRNANGRKPVEQDESASNIFCMKRPISHNETEQKNPLRGISVKLQIPASASEAMSSDILAYKVDEALNFVF